MRAVLITIKAMKQLKRIPEGDQREIRTAIRQLAHWPDVRHVRALTGLEGYRLRVGRFRVLFRLEDGSIHVTEVKKRDEHTY